MSHSTPGLVSNGTPQIAVIIPCHNEAVAIGKVIEDFRMALPGATIFAYDNCSTDDTSRVAELRGEVDVQSVDVDGQTVLLCSRGGRRAAAAMERAAAGVARILRVAA